MSMQGFLQITKDLYFNTLRLDITPTQKTVLQFITGKSLEWPETRQTRQVVLSCRYIAKGIGIAFDKVSIALKELKNLGFIAIQRLPNKNKGRLITLLYNGSAPVQSVTKSITPSVTKPKTLPGEVNCNQSLMNNTYTPVSGVTKSVTPGVTKSITPQKERKSGSSLVNTGSIPKNEGVTKLATKPITTNIKNKQEQSAPLPLPTEKEIAPVVCSLENISVKEEAVNISSSPTVPPMEIASVCCFKENNVQEKAVSSVPVPVTPSLENTSVVVLEKNSVKEEAVNVPISPIARLSESIVVPVVNRSLEATKEEERSSDCKSVSSLSSMGLNKVNEECSAPSPYSAAPLPQENTNGNVYKPQNELKIEKGIDTSKTEKVTPAPSGVNPIDYNKLYNLFVDNTKNDNILINRDNFKKTVNMYLSKIENIEEVILEIANQMKTRKTNDNWTNFLTLCYEKSITAISVPSSNNASNCPVNELKTQESKSITIAEKVAINASSGNSAPLPKPIPSDSLAAAGKQDIITLIKSSLPVSDSAIYAGIDILKQRNSIDLLADIKEIIASQKNANGTVKDHTRYFVSLCKGHKLVQSSQKANTTIPQELDPEELQFRANFMRNLRIKYDNKEINAVKRANGKEETIFRINGWIIETYDGADIDMRKLPLELLDIKYFTKKIHMIDMSQEEKSKMFAQLWAILDKKKV